MPIHFVITNVNLTPINTKIICMIAMFCDGILVYLQYVMRLCRPESGEADGAFMVSVTATPAGD